MVLWAGLPGCSPAPGPDAVPPRLSILALGDTGVPPTALRRVWNRQLSLARALEHEDRRQPAQALVFLGDNFYPSGLQEKDFEDRVRTNLVRPYCRFLALTPRGEERFGGACGTPPAERNAGAAIHAVFGNHDYAAPESPRLQREELPRWIGNWSIPPGQAEAVELGEGVSLVLFDSLALARGEASEALRAALARTRGRWLVLAAHHPLGRGINPGTRDAGLLARALVATGRRAHVMLAGHVHNLQALELADPLPSLELVVGSGRQVEPPLSNDPGLRFAALAQGFARVDLVGEGPDEHLVASLHALPARGHATGRAERVAAFAVRADGHVEPLAAR